MVSLLQSALDTIPHFGKTLFLIWNSKVSQSDPFNPLQSASICGTHTLFFSPTFPPFLSTGYQQTYPQVVKYCVDNFTCG